MVKAAIVCQSLRIDLLGEADDGDHLWSFFARSTASAKELILEVLLRVSLLGELCQVRCLIVGPSFLLTFIVVLLLPLVHATLEVLWWMWLATGSTRIAFVIVARVLPASEALLWHSSASRSTVICHL